MRAKPEMQPWVHTDKSRMSSVGVALTGQAFVLRFGSAAPTGLKKCVETINPGRKPWAMQEYRPLGARLCFLHQSITSLRLIRFPFFRYLQVVVRNGKMDGIR